MPVENIPSAPPPAAIHSGAPAQTAAPKQTLDGEVFLKLLVTQLTNQDPSSPMDTNAMISQTTQLAMMEQLTTLSETGTEAFALNMRQAATAIIGHEVSFEDVDGTIVTGVVSKVSFDGPIPQVTVGDKNVALDLIAGITAKTTAASSSAAS
jgi:flagellar basal-body rod modification protein FlgD